MTGRRTYGTSSGSEDPRTGRESGFTLVELMMVVAIIGIILAFAIPNYLGMQDSAKIASVEANMRVIQVAVESFAMRNEGFYPTSADQRTLLGNLTLQDLLPGGQTPKNPYTGKPTNLNWSSVRGTSPSTDPGGGICLNVYPGAEGSGPDSYDIVATDKHGNVLPMALSNY